MQTLLEKGITTRRKVMLSHSEMAYSKYGYKLPLSESLSSSSII